jgi:effector-binding domain-containing protein
MRMLGEPAVIERTEEAYVAIKASVTMQTIGSVLPGLHPEVRNWLRERGTSLAGAPFFKFNVIDMERQMEVEVGWPVAAEMKGDDRVLAGVLPAGRYASVLYTGHPDGLLDATRDLQEWAAGQGLEWDVTSTPAGDRWRARLEIYRSDDPDMSKWETELAFKLAGD